MHNLLQRMNELAVESATGTNEAFDRTQLAKEFERLKREINDISEQTTFNNINVLDGTLSAAGLERSAYTSGIYKTFQEVLPTSEPSSIDSVILDGGRLFQAGSNRNSFDMNFSGFGVFAAKAGEVTIAGKTYSVNNRTINDWGTSASLDDLADQINKTGGIEMTLATGEKQTLKASRVGAATLRLTADERVLASNVDLNKLASELKFRIALPAGGAAGDINGNGKTGAATVATKDNSTYATSAKKTFSFDFSKAKAGASFEIGDRLFLFEDSKNNSKTMREKLAEREKQYLSSGENKSVTRVDLAIVDNEDMLINTINAAFSEADGIVQRQAADNSSGVSYNQLKEQYDNAKAVYDAAMKVVADAQSLLNKANTTSTNAGNTLNQKIKEEENAEKAENTATANRIQGEKDRDKAVAEATASQTARDTAWTNLEGAKTTLQLKLDAQTAAAQAVVDAQKALQDAIDDMNAKKTAYDTADSNLTEAKRQLKEAQDQKAIADQALTDRGTDLTDAWTALNTAYSAKDANDKEVTRINGLISDQQDIITAKSAESANWAAQIGDGTSAGLQKDYNDKEAIWKEIGIDGGDAGHSNGLFHDMYAADDALKAIDKNVDPDGWQDAKGEYDRIKKQLDDQLAAHPNYVQDLKDAFKNLDDAQKAKQAADDAVTAARNAIGDLSSGLTKDLADAKVEQAKTDAAYQAAQTAVQDASREKDKAQAEVDRLNKLINGDTTTGDIGLLKKQQNADDAVNNATTGALKIYNDAKAVVGKDGGDKDSSDGAYYNLYDMQGKKATADTEYTNQYDVVYNATTGLQKVYNDAATDLTKKRQAETAAIDRLGDATKGLIKTEIDKKADHVRATNTRKLAELANTNAKADVVKAQGVKDAADAALNTPKANFETIEKNFNASAVKSAYDAVFDKYKYQLAQEVEASFAQGGTLIRLEYIGTDAAKRDSLTPVGLESGKKGIDNLGIQGDKYLTMAVHAMDKRGLGEVTYELDLSKLESGDTITWENKNGRVYEHRYMEGDSLEKIYDQLGISKDETITIDGNTWKVQNESKKIGTLRIGFEARDDIEAYKRGTLKMQVGAKEGEQLNLNVNALNTKTLKLDDAEIYTQQDASAAITATREAINAVSDQRAAMGAMQNRLSHKMQNLSVSIENLQVSESRIRDVDMASKMTEFTKSNILAQAATSMLAQANSNSQLVLSLLRS